MAAAACQGFSTRDRSYMEYDCRGINRTFENWMKRMRHCTDWGQITTRSGRNGTAFWYNNEGEKVNVSGPVADLYYTCCQCMCLMYTFPYACMQWSTTWFLPYDKDNGNQRWTLMESPFRWIEPRACNKCHPAPSALNPLIRNHPSPVHYCTLHIDFHLN